MVPRVASKPISIPPTQARILADFDFVKTGDPAGCESVDRQTSDDLDLGVVFGVVDHTTSMIGAQALWRWLHAPAIDRAALDARERKIQLGCDPVLRARIAKASPRDAVDTAGHVPMMLWGDLEPVTRTHFPFAMMIAAIGAIVLAIVDSGFIVPAATIGAANGLIDAFNVRVALYEDMLIRLGSVLDAAASLATDERVPAELRAEVAADLPAYRRLVRKLNWLRLQDPFSIIQTIRAVIGLRVHAVGECMAIINEERDHLRRLVLWVGELDAAQALHDQRGATRAIPAITTERVFAATDLVHPVLDAPVANDLALRTGMLITGTNASGKSTYLRAIALNALLAQSLRMTFSRTWSGPLVRVRCAMRIQDDITVGQSTYAAEVATVGALVREAAPAGLPSLFVLDEPFHGTNPLARVPIVIGVLEHLADHHFVIAATHDLDVAQRVSDRFVRGYFSESETGGYDRKLKAGIARTSNAVALLEQAGFPAELLARVRSAS